MSRACLCSLVFLSIAFASPAAARARQPSPPTAERPAPAAVPDEEVDHEALRQLRHVYERAVNENQLELLAPLLHPDFFGVMITNEHVRNLEEMRAYWGRIRALMGEGGRYTTTVNPERSVILGDLALARGTTDDLVVTDEGQEYRFSTSWTVVAQRDGGQWKLLRAQGTMDPVQNEFVRTFMRRAAMQTGLIAGLIGLLAGALAGVVFSRSRARRA